MDFTDKHYHVITELPATLTFVLSQSIPLRYLRPEFSLLGACESLCFLTAKQGKGEEIEVTLPEKLACYGEGRYEVCVHDEQCQVCDCIEVWFEADCQIVSSSIQTGCPE